MLFKKAFSRDWTGLSLSLCKASVFLQSLPPGGKYSGRGLPEYFYFAQ